MNIRKYLIALTVLMLALLPAACGAQEEPSGDLPELVIGSDDYRPYNYLDENGQAAGVDVALATEACRRMATSRCSGRSAGTRRISFWKAARWIACGAASP